jgi:hypothetical protein
MPAPQFESREWRAAPRNLSPNGIHDDDRAQELGFDGGFVTGVVLYEHIAAELLNQGLDWLNDGRVEMRFRRPVYDQEEVSFSVDATENGYTIRGDDDMGPRSTGVFSLDRDAPDVPAGTPAPHFDAPLGAPSQVGVLMRIEETKDMALFDEMAANSAFPRGSERNLMPVAEWVNPISMLYEYFGRSTTIHFVSRVWHHNPLFEDETFTTSGVITGFSERRGNQIVDFTALVAASDGRPIATIEHSSVYRLARERAAEG